MTKWYFLSNHRELLNFNKGAMMPLPHNLIARRINDSTIIESLESSFVTAILGPRRVGKSTFIEWYRDQHQDRRWVKFNMDILSQRKKMANGFLQEEIEKQALQKINGQPKLWVVIDEAQKCPEIFDQVKVLYDEYKHNNAIKFILTGSASLDLHNLSAESLAGRIELVNMREFTIREMCMYKYGIDIQIDSLFQMIIRNPSNISSVIQQLMPYKTILQEALDFQLIFGGLPEVIALDTERERFRYLDQYIQSYLEKDVRKVAEIADIDLYQKLLEVLTEQTGSLRDDTHLLESLGCARNTLKKYRGYLIATMVYQEVYPIMNNALKRIIKSPKGYIKNNGIISILTGLDNIDLLKSSSKIGHRFENWFLKELQVWLDREIKRHRIYFWRNAVGLEVDFIVERKPDLIPFEVTYRDRIDSKKLKNLATFMSKANNAPVGILIYNGEYVFKENLNIHCIPAWAVA